ncbi:hypothetical protein PHET_06842 [Paragonimus heterotremus]|uniref:Uncharacterized protein n=1 Tax=Paragonimus heterotremus TaxID=100268 RepID=A0A8J4SNA0_9TREM|nr:hypothetical protein PHET_06842 [Paragonimus heterotremus]
MSKYTRKYRIQNYVFHTTYLFSYCFVPLIIPFSTFLHSATIIIAGILIGCFGFLFLIVCLPWRRCCSCFPKSPDSHQRELEVVQQLSPPPYYECWVEELPPAYKDVQLVRTEACSSNSSQEHVHCSTAYRQNETSTPTSLPPEYESTQSIRDMENSDAV